VKIEESFFKIDIVFITALFNFFTDQVIYKIYTIHQKKLLPLRTRPRIYSSWDTSK
jgi:hypothetical protein